MVPGTFNRLNPFRHLFNQRNISFLKRAQLVQELKEDDAVCKQQMESGDYLFYYKGKPLLGAGPIPNINWIDFPLANKLQLDLKSTSVLLGVSDSGTAQFATNLSSKEDPSLIEMDQKSRFTDLRSGLFMVRPDLAQTLTRGWSLLMWSRKTNFCSNCGSRLVRSVSGSQARCESGGCGATFYPTTTPVGIVAVVDAETDRILLVRQPRFPPGMFSCVAGFLDVGETLEDCVRREVAEEVGLEVENVSYRSSQHWPFPSGSLMIGCHALVKPGQTVQIDKKEIQEARWFTRKEVASALKVSLEDPLVGVRGKDFDNVFVPPSGALAHHLIKDWHLS